MKQNYGNTKSGKTIKQEIHQKIDSYIVIIKSKSFTHDLN